jgi:hypothetical protein
MLHYIDAESIVPVDDQVVHAWTTTLTSGGAPKFADLTAIALKEVNRETRQMRALRSVEYHSRSAYDEPV